MEPRISLTSMPMPLRWGAEPVRCETDGGRRVRIATGARTDLFVDPGGDHVLLNAPRLLGTPPDGDFVLSARVTVEFAGTYDAGVLLLWADESRWAKVCFERSPAGTNMIVSVVNRRCSDDANGYVVDGSTTWLRVARLGRAFAFHASSDGEHWNFVRYFDLGTESVQVGLEVQAPVGDGCAATFEDIEFASRRLTDLRDGS
jgi:regulation of enolase protein 1 (concanavalin A-like superfamily)